MKSGDHGNSADHLRRADLLKLLECAVDLQEQTDPAALPRQTLGILTKLMPAEIVGYNEMDVARGQGLHYECSIGNPPYLMEALQRNIHQHPLIQFFNTKPDAPARSISEFCSRTRFSRLALYDELYRVLRVEDQIAITLVSDAGSLIGMTANRAGWGFSPRERALLTMLRPHVAAAHRNAQKVKSLEDQAAQHRRTLGELPQGLAARDRFGKWIWINEAAVQLLARYFPIPRTRANVMPDAIERLDAAQCGEVEKTLKPAKPLVVKSAEGTLTVSLLALSNGLRIAWFGDHSFSTASTAMRRLGLTARETEVMYWVLRGKTNPQIALLLHMSPRTVQKHLEHVFHKWNVETRTLAAVYAREMLGA